MILRRLLRMVAFACQMQTARSEMRIEFGQGVIPPPCGRTPTGCGAGVKGSKGVTVSKRVETELASYLIE
jgi:hypothetical protein